uniref:Amino acid transporter transmembrane domain-containing protein n=1 Tax=Oryza barthii TaxID=65489 RepID=A0A0D3GIX5_9ORYZ
MGMLSMLYALSACGSAWRSISPIFGAICFYTGNLNNRCMRADHCVRSYPDIGHLMAICGYGQMAIGLVMNVELYLVTNLDKLLLGTVLSLARGNMFCNTAASFGRRTCLNLISGAIILPKTWLKNLSMLAYVSAVELVRRWR